MFVHNIDPVAIAIGQLKVHWYGLMYLISFISILIFSRMRLGRYPHIKLDGRQLTDFVTVYSVLGVVIGGRVGYVLFYGFDRFVADPLFLFRIWEGGMSFHGGLIGVIIATWLFTRGTGVHLIDFFDFMLVGLPIGLMLGRIGNFIGGELWGRATDLPWGVVFPSAGLEPRHPSQLYQAALEGLLLWLLLWWLASKPRPRMLLSGCFLVGYALARIGVELVREPDAHIGYLAYNLVTMGMLLSLPLLVVGLLVIAISLARNQQPAPVSNAGQARNVSSKRKRKK